VRQQLESPRLAAGRGDDAVRAPRHAGDLAEMLLAQALKEFLRNPVGQPHASGKLHEGDLPHDVDRLEGQVLEQVLADARFLDGPGDGDFRGCHEQGSPFLTGPSGGPSWQIPPS